MIHIKAEELQPLQFRDVATALLMDGAEDVARFMLRAEKTVGLIGPAARSAISESYRRQPDIAAMIDDGIAEDARAWASAAMLAGDGTRFIMDLNGYVAGVRSDHALVGTVADWRWHITTVALRVARQHGGAIAGRGRLQVVA